VQEICPEKETVFNTLSLSSATMTQWVEDISSDLLYKVRNKQKNWKAFVYHWMRVIAQAILLGY
jgi:hypothetical protein